MSDKGHVDSSYSVKIDNYGRRTWDTNEYERKARDRIEESQKEVAKKKAQPYDLYKAKEDKEEGLVSSDSDDDAFEDWDFSERRERKSKKNKDEPPVKRSLLQKRDYKVDLDSKLGKSVVVNKNAPSTSGGGYYCNACDCVVKDSINFLDHINGKKHQRNLGMSMKVERSSLDQVKNRFAQLKKKSEEKEKEYNLSQKVTDMQEEEDKYKSYLKEKKKERKRKAEEDKQLDGGLDPDMAAMMGFSGFGGSKKS